MNTKFTIKNFRVFDENGATLDLKPLTILTGCNSSGKSSIVKAMLILKHFFMQIKNANDKKTPINLFNYKIDIATDELKSLGNFANTINLDSESKEVTFEYTIYSLMLSQDVMVSLTFSVDNNDELKNGFLKKVSMKTNDKEFFSSYSKDSIYTCNLNVVKNECIDFLELEYLIHGYCSIYGEYNYDSIPSKSDKEYKELMNEAKNKIREYDENRGKDVLKFVYSSQIQNQEILRRYDINPSIFDWIRKNGSYFKIPVISEIDNAGKEGILTLINQKLMTEMDSEEMRFASEKIANDFISSETSSFFDYFKMHEEKYLESVKHVNFIFRGMPDGYDFAISQHYTSMNPEKWENVSFDEKTSLRQNEEKAEETICWRTQPVDFPMLYEILMRWNKTVLGEKDEDNNYFIFNSSIEPFGGYIHYAYRALGAFLTNIVNEVLNPEPWVGVAYSSSSRVDANPYYSLSDNSSFSIALKKYFDARRIFQDKKLGKSSKFKIGSYINNWIQKLEIGDSISFDIMPNLDIVSPRLHKQSDDIGCFLTDVGFGITQLLSVLITVETQILSRIIDSYSYKGINRIEGLQDLFKLYKNWEPKELKMRSFLYDTIAIEEPEIHLHPSYQSWLADMFVEAYTKLGVHFVIETHSEYLIRKLQTLVLPDSNYTIDREMISILYLNNSDVNNRELGEPQVKRIEICANGYLDDNFGSGFFDEALISLKKLQK